MRKQDRLDKFYDELKQLHKSYVPDWRFFQMMINFISSYGDPFFLEEDESIEELKKYLQNNNPWKRTD